MCYPQLFWFFFFLRSYFDLGSVCIIETWTSLSIWLPPATSKHSWKSFGRTFWEVRSAHLDIISTSFTASFGFIEKAGYFFCAIGYSRVHWFIPIYLVQVLAGYRFEGVLKWWVKSNSLGNNKEIEFSPAIKYIFFSF